MKGQGVFFAREIKICTGARVDTFAINPTVQNLITLAVLPEGINNLKIAESGKKLGACNWQ